MDIGLLEYFCIHRELFTSVTINFSQSPEEIIRKFLEHEDLNVLEDKIFFLTEECKSTTISTTLRKEGNVKFLKKDLNDASMYYHVSICKAPRDSVEYALAFANRSVFLFQVHQYKDCLKDIETILRSEYPKNSLYKVYIRQAKCFLKIKCYKKAAVAVGVSEKLLETTKSSLATSEVTEAKTDIKKLRRSLSKMPASDQNVKVEPEFILPNLKDDENPDLPSVSNALEVQSNSGKFAAAININKGDVLIVEKPRNWILSVQSHKNFSFCHYCLKRTSSCIPCISCSSTYFCSDKCRQINWDLYHKWQCAGFRRNILTPQMSLALKILVYNEYSTSTNKKEDLFEFTTGGEQWIDKEKCSIEDLRRFAQDAILLVHYLQTYTDYFEWLYNMTDRPPGSKQQLLKMTGTFLFKCLYKIEQYSSEILNIVVDQGLFFNYKVLEMQYFCLGLGIYRTTLRLKKECSPNAVISYHRNVFVVKAITTIKKGEDIIVSNNKCNFFEWDDESNQMKLKKDCDLCQCVGGKHNALFGWRCPKCEERVLPIHKTNDGQCSACYEVFSLEAYKRQSKKVAESLSSIANVSLLKDLKLDYITKTHNAMRKIYYRYNFEFSIIYRALIFYYRSQGEFYLSLQYGQMLSDLCKTLLGDASPQYAAAMMKFTFCLVHLFKDVKSKSNMEAFNVQRRMLSDSLEKSRRVLCYNASNNDVADFTTFILDFLKTSLFTED